MAFGRATTGGSLGGVVRVVVVADTRDFTRGMTLEAWVRATALATTWRAVANKETSGGLVYSLFANTDTRQPYGQIFSGGAYREARGTAQIALSTWTHLAVTYDGANLRLYVNGTQVSSTAATGTMATSAGPFRIGGNSIWSEWFRGQIDELRVYNRALSVSEVTTDMNTAISP